MGRTTQSLNLGQIHSHVTLHLSHSIKKMLYVIICCLCFNILFVIYGCLSGKCSSNFSCATSFWVFKDQLVSFRNLDAQRCDSNVILTHDTNIQRLMLHAWMLLLLNDAQTVMVLKLVPLCLIFDNRCVTALWEWWGFLLVSSLQVYTF